MKIGIDIPYLASTADVRTYVRESEALGFDFLGFSEHVCSTVDSPFPAPIFSFDDPWRETATFGAFVAALTSTIEINPAMMLLPLYPPVLAAKQIAELANLSDGRIRIAASIGWNPRETESLGVDPTTRGARFEEQLTVIRRLWSERVVDHEGEFFHLRQVGISQRPAAPIPVWMGAGRMEANGMPGPIGLSRAAMIADGFKFAAPSFLEQNRVADLIGELRSLVAARNRDPATFGIEVRMPVQMTTPDQWPEVYEWAKSVGATHLGISNRIAGGTMRDLLTTSEHILATFPRNS